MEAHRPRVLVVEDDDGVRTLLCLQLEESGYEVEGARDGYEGLRRMRNARYQVVLTDYRMPEMDGLQLLEAIKTQWPQTPVIFVSGAIGEPQRHALAHGASGWVGKPWDHACLLRIIQIAIGEACVVQSGVPS